MIPAIILIIAGLVIWLMLPGWINVNGNARNVVNIACTVIGIIMAVAGVIDLIHALF